MKTREYLTAIILSVISAFIYNLVTKKFPSFDILKKILSIVSKNLSSYYSAIFIFLVVFLLVILYYKNRGGISFAVISSSQKPEYIRLRGLHSRFGVIWSFLCGHTLLSVLIDKTAGDYVYVEGPFCPKCLTEVIESSKNWILCKKQVWICPKCNRTVYRSNKFYRAEKKIVEKSIERDLRIKDFILINGKKEPELKDNTTYVFEIK
ncbi:MAG: hypothetical protein HXS48_24675 [Theionarchaea archaeon]|nr:hypothetical protein [Theionarchaea archaeon]